MQSDTAKIPYSQDVTKPQTATPDECIADLMRLVQAFPDRVISRNFYRVEGSLAESAWTAHFGTFTEFKKQAGVTPSRHAQRLEKAIAKHASTTLFRQMNGEKSGWEDRYLRPSGERFSTDIVVTDVHDKDCDPFWRRVLMETIARVQPRRIVIGGDLFDLPEFSKFTQDPREWDVVGRIRWVHDFLQEMREAACDAEVVLVEGNHEYRLLRHLAEQTPAMRAILSDLHGFTVSKLLGLDRFEINLIARADLSSFNERDIKEELRRNYYVAPGGQYLIHHFPEGMEMKLPGGHGHHHRHFAWQHYTPTHGAFEWHQMGCGHRRVANYTAGEKWGNGFLMLHVDNAENRVVHEYVQVRDHAVVGGRWYSRLSSER